MNVVIALSPLHRTYDGHRGQYATISNALTGRTVGRFHLVTRQDGSTFYRAVDGTAYPAGLDSTTVIPYAIDEQTKRRAARPPRPPKPPRPPLPPRQRQRDGRPPDNMRPFHCPQDPARWLRRTPDTARPMRRRLCEKLQQRYATKGVA